MPQTNAKEVSVRMAESKALLNHVWGTTWTESISQLLNDPACKKPQENSAIPTEELLAFKDRQRISDADWNDIVTTFKLSGKLNFLIRLTIVRQSFNTLH